MSKQAYKKIKDKLEMNELESWFILDEKYEVYKGTFSFDPTQLTILKKA